LAEYKYFDKYKHLLEDPNTMLSYDQNGQSQLLTCLMGCLNVENADKIDCKPFEFLLKLLFNSHSKIAFKKMHFTNALYGVYVKLDEKSLIQHLFPELVEFLAEQKGTDEEAKTAGLRQIILDPSLTKQSKIMDTSVFTDAISEDQTEMEKMIQLIREAH
jgi:hypothetical protein